MKQLNVRKIFILTVTLSVLLAILIISLTIYTLSTQTEEHAGPEIYILLAISLTSLASAAMSLLLLRPASVLNLKLKQSEDSLDNLDRLNKTLRAQRHDFMNHLQVVHSLIELKQYEEAGDYIEKVHTSIEKINSILKTGLPAVNAILEAKRQACESKGIDTTVEIRSNLTKIPIHAWELCRIFGNIIDNAAHALEDMRETTPRIHIEIYEDMISYGFKITNNGPSVPPELWKKIFEAGYKTPDSSGEGMGLYITKQIIEKHGGRIKIFSNENETAFEGTVPRT